MTVSTLQAAQQWVEQGYSVFPLHRDKRPAISQWADLQRRQPTPAELLMWFGRHNNYNLALVTGVQGLTVIDFDSLEAYLSWREWASSNLFANFVAENTFQVLTARGVHVYIALDQPMRCKPTGKKIDIKSQGGYVVAPPSIHLSGHQYEAIDPQSIIVPVPTLADVLPNEIWDTGPEIAPVVPAARVPVAPMACDPWEAADNSRLGRDPVETAKLRWPIERMVTGCEPSSDDGRWLRAHCILHDDRRQSAWIDTVRQLYGCHACCQKPLDAINLYARLRGGLTLREAIAEMLRA